MDIFVSILFVIVCLIIGAFGFFVMLIPGRIGDVVPGDPAAPSKKPWLSKTILLNALVAALLLAEANISGLQGFLPAAKYEVVAFLLPIVNMLLRVYTSQGLSFKPVMPPGAGQ